MSQMLSWEEIIKQFNNEWVELTEFDWPEGEPYPKAGTVRTHAREQSEFYKLLKLAPAEPYETALAFAGIPPREPNTTYINPLKYF